MADKKALRDPASKKQDFTTQWIFAQYEAGEAVSAIAADAVRVRESMGTLS